MKRNIWVPVLLCMVLLTGCAATEKPDEAAVQPPETGSTRAETHDVLIRHEAETLNALIVNGAETGKLLLAGEGAGEVYILDLEDAIVYLDGKRADAAQLEDGMTVEVVYEGEVSTSMPAQIDQIDAVSAWSRGTEKNPFYDLCGLYLKVLNDLWDEGVAYTADVRCVSVDLSDAPGELSPAAKQAVAWSFASAHGMEALTLRKEELAAQGYLSGGANTRKWKDGVLLCISADEWAEGETYALPVIKFSATLWRANTQRLTWAGCTAMWPELGSWSDYSRGEDPA